MTTPGADTYRGFDLETLFIADCNPEDVIQIVEGKTTSTLTQLALSRLGSNIGDKGMDAEEKFTFQNIGSFQQMADLYARMTKLEKDIRVLTAYLAANPDMTEKGRSFVDRVVQKKSQAIDRLRQEHIALSQKEEKFSFRNRVTPDEESLIPLGGARGKISELFDMIEKNDKLK